MSLINPGEIRSLAHSEEFRTLCCHIRLPGFNPDMLAEQSANSLKEAKQDLQREFKSRLPDNQFQFIVLRDTQSGRYFKSIGRSIPAKRLAIEVHISDQGQYSLITPEQFEKMSGLAKNAASKLGLQAIIADFFFETDSPDSGLIHQMYRNEKNRSTRSSRFALALASRQATVVSDDVQGIMKEFRLLDPGILLNLRKELSLIANANNAQPAPDPIVRPSPV